MKLVPSISLTLLRRKRSLSFRSVISLIEERMQLVDGMGDGSLPECSVPACIRISWVWIGPDNKDDGQSRWTKTSSGVV